MLLASLLALTACNPNAPYSQVPLAPVNIQYDLHIQTLNEQAELIANQRVNYHVDGFDCNGLKGVQTATGIRAPLDGESQPTPITIPIYITTGCPTQVTAEVQYLGKTGMIVYCFFTAPDGTKVPGDDAKQVAKTGTPVTATCHLNAS